MSKIFRIYREGTSTYRGWNENPAFPYNQNARETIADPDGANARNEITSIPSPFARIDLVKTAFKEVCRRASQNLGQLDGNTIYHKMVSDTLDVGEIFFNIDKLKDKVEIITWEPQANLAALKSDGNVSHYYVADSLEKYLQSDASAYNFGHLQNIYLLNYKAGPDELNIIGATSPATFFFSGANNLDYVNDIYFADNDRPFDSDYQPLYRRDFEYLKAWFTLRKNNRDNFSRLFPEVDEYLNLTFRAIKDNGLKQTLNSVGSSSLDDYSTLDVTSEGRVNQVEVLGISLLKKKAAGNVSSQSDFTIKSELPGEEKLPLVLPVEAGNKYADLNYVNGRFGKDNKAPYVDGMDDYAQRALPYDGSLHPYLTISDFLEDTVIEVPHRLNIDDYFDGNLNGCKARVSYLLPLKPLYFKFFTTDNLMSVMPDGKKAFEMQSLAGGSVSVTLRVPISGNSKVKYIEYTRNYYKNNAANVLENSGGMVNFEFAGFVMPGVKFQSEANAYYTISSITTFSVQAVLQFYKGFASVQGVGMDCRDDKNSDDGFKIDTYTLSHSNFDYIRVSRKDGISGILCPKFDEHQELNSFEFAVDLGTSNTHIEMKSENVVSEPFSCRSGDSLMSKFYVPSYREIDGKRLQEDLLQEEPIMDTDYLPSVIGCGTDCFFPTRTAMACAKTIDWSKSLRVFGLLNFNMMHDKKKNRSYNSAPLVNIKWSNDAHAKEAMRLYIENILLIIRNKVIMGDGRLSQTKITWFYPDSMSGLRLSQMKQAWNDAYHKLFSPTDDSLMMSESVAPIRYYFNLYATATNIVNVDIGGGTTDIAFSKGGDVDYITSFRFAANALFQDSLSDINPRNGIIDYFQNRFGELLHGKDDEINYGDLPVIYDRNVNHPANMASFLFSLKNISLAKQFSRSEIDFNYILQEDEKFKLVFVLFYTAIIYHIAQIVKSKGLDLPRHISFSGNGSRIVSVVTSDMEALSSYTKCVFEQVLGVKYNSDLDILGFGKDSNPKEATCKGGLLPANSYADTEMVNLVLKDSDGQFIGSSDKYSAIDEEYKKQVVASVEHFFDMAFNVLPEHFDMRTNFAITSETLDIARKVCSKDLLTFLDKGINMSVAECGGDTSSVIEEALGFYPIKGAIQALSEKLHEYYKSQN